MKYQKVAKPKWTKDIPTSRYGQYDDMIEEIKKLKGTEAVVVESKEVKTSIGNFKSYISARSKKMGCPFRIKLHLKEEENKVYIWKLDRWS